jgi:hypothetical protein
VNENLTFFGCIELNEEDSDEFGENLYLIESNFIMEKNPDLNLKNLKKCSPFHSDELQPFPIYKIQYLVRLKIIILSSSKSNSIEFLYFGEGKDEYSWTLLDGKIELGSIDEMITCAPDENCDETFVRGFDFLFSKYPQIPADQIQAEFGKEVCELLKLIH